MSRKPPFTVKRAYGAGCVRIAVTLSASRFGEDVAVTGSRKIPAAEARALAAELVAAADRVDAVAAEKAAAEGRREKWREREVAAGRMIVLDAGDVFGGRRR